MGIKNTQSFYINLVRIFILLSVIGVAILIYTSLQNDPSNLAFSLIAFVISVAALVMTTLQSLSIARQVRITEKAARLVSETSVELKYLVKEDRKLEKEIRQDIVLDHEIIAVLEEFGIGESEEDRRKVATRITKKIGRG
ncbi:MAG: hypothetical protein JWO61_253 [Candidatus Saccharibacteria bacterium]|nr:hypothetical protein [Candidatus Saccharibacteria bacterium]